MQRSERDQHAERMEHNAHVLESIERWTRDRQIYLPERTSCLEHLGSPLYIEDASLECREAFFAHNAV